MNNRYEVCRSCPNQCALETKSQIVIDSLKKRKISTNAARQRMSVISQEGAGMKCPNSEISRVRGEIAEASRDPALLRVVNRVNLSIRPSTNLPPMPARKGSLTFPGRKRN